VHSTPKPASASAPADTAWETSPGISPANASALRPAASAASPIAAARPRSASVPARSRSPVVPPAYSRTGNAPASSPSGIVSWSVVALRAAAGAGRAGTVSRHLRRWSLRRVYGSFDVPALDRDGGAVKRVDDLPDAHARRLADEQIRLLLCEPVEL